MSEYFLYEVDGFPILYKQAAHYWGPALFIITQLDVYALDLESDVFIDVWIEAASCLSALEATRAPTANGYANNLAVRCWFHTSAGRWAPQRAWDSDVQIPIAGEIFRPEPDGFLADSSLNVIKWGGYKRSINEGKGDVRSRRILKKSWGS